MTTSFAELHAYLHALLNGEAYRGSDDPNGIWRNTTRPVATVGLLLEAKGETPGWIARERIDALIVHRPWSLQIALPGDPGVLAYHSAFDQRLAIGMNPLLADALEVTRLEVFGEEDERPLGMIGNVQPVSLATFAARIVGQFGGVNLLPDIAEGAVRRVAVVGAMRPSLVAEAAERGADLYLTGDLRASALPAAESAGITVACVGKRAAERWALRALASLLQEQFADLRVVLGPT